MLGYIARRLLQGLLVLWLTTVVAFVVLRLSPGDPAATLLGGQASAGEMEAYRSELGLDRPLLAQYLNYLWGVVRGDLGTSFRSFEPVTSQILQRLPPTLLLLAAAMCLSLAAGVPAGIVAAVHRGRPMDRLIMTASILSLAIPTFWLGLMLIIVFSVQLRLFPTSGVGTWKHLVLPAVSLAMYQVGLVARLTRTSMCDVLSADFVRTGRAKGLPELRVVLKHALKNAALPVVTVLGIQTGILFGGSVVTETVFAWPGVGTLAVNAIYQRDFPIVQGVVLLFAAVFVILNLAVDLLYSLLDPRVSYE